MLVQMKLKRHWPVTVVTIAALCVSAGSASGGDWLTHPSTFTHAPSGVRVSQFAPVDAPPLNDQSQLVTGGYTNYRSTIQYAQTADNYHRVNQWGAPVRPYGEWNYPFRPYSVPYAAWGPPFAGLNVGVGYPYGGYRPSWPYLGLPYQQYIQNPAGPYPATNPLIGNP